jgi:hypothetical protein
MSRIHKFHNKIRETKFRRGWWVELILEKYYWTKGLLYAYRITYDINIKVFSNTESDI